MGAAIHYTVMIGRLSSRVRTLVALPVLYRLFECHPAVREAEH